MPLHDTQAFASISLYADHRNEDELEDAAVGLRVPYGWDAYFQEQGRCERA